MNQSLIYKKYQELVNTPSDINEHLPVIRKYAEQSEVIVEMGVRWIVSTWALLAGSPKKLTSLDLYNPVNYGGNIDEVYFAASQDSIDFKFIEQDSLTYDMDECDLLFIDTWHDFLQLKKELYRHHRKVKKYIILHDTVSYGFTNEDLVISGNHSEAETNLPKGLVPAIEEFLMWNKEWVIWEKRDNNNGLTVLKKIV